MTTYSLEVYADEKKLPIKQLVSWGLSTEDSSVAIPYYAPNGEVLRMRYRHAPGTKTRFSYGPGEKTALYGLQKLEAFREQGTIVLCEGESDTHTLWHHGFPAVGLPGSASFKDEWADHFDGFDEVFVVIENDQGGQAVLKSITKKRSEFKQRVRLVRPTRYKDVSALHLDSPESFRVRFKNAMEAAEPWTQYAEREVWVRELEHEQSCALGFSWTLDCERVLAGGVSR